MTGQTPPSDLKLDNSLWRMASALWEVPDFERACLQAQKEAVSVTHVLVALYSATHGKHWNALEPQALTDWRCEVTEVIRGLRQRLPKDNEAVAQLRDQVKSAELSAEQVELAWWAQLIEREDSGSLWSRSDQDISELAAANLESAGLGDAQCRLREQLIELWRHHGKGVMLPNAPTH